MTEAVVNGEGLAEWRAPLSIAAEPAAVELPLDASVRMGRVAPAEVRQARAWFSRTVEPGSLDVHRLLAQVGPVQAMDLIRAGSAPAAVQRMAAARRDDDRSLSDLTAADRLGVRLVTPEDEEWPDEAMWAMEIASGRGEPDLAPPQALWVRGSIRLDLALRRSVAIVGSRAITGYGNWMAGTIAHDLAGKGWTIVSGGAEGIDTTAHRGALAVGGRTVAITAGGLEAPYPSGNMALFERIADTGLLISEWPPDCPPQRHRFLLRNRLIAGLTAGTVVVEAAHRSGARATARRARDLGKPVMAVPGPVTSVMSTGPHEMIRGEGAVLVTSGDEVLELIGAIGDDLAPLPDSPPTTRDMLNPIARRVLEGLPAAGPAGPEQIGLSAGVPVLDVIRCLPSLELHGFIRSDRDGWRLTTAGRR
jgi:DNA processing protein